MTDFHAFISHKTEDQSIAQALKGALETLSKNKLKVHHSGEMPAGEDWREWIDKRLIESQALLFLYTTLEKRDWRWCSYEIGTFHGHKIRRQETSNTNIYCIKHPDIPNPPPPIEHIQVCDADENSLSELFGKLIYKKNVFAERPLVEEPLTGKEDRKNFDETIEKIVKAFKPPVKIELFEKRLEINLSKIVKGKIVQRDIDNAEITGNDDTMKFLNLPEGTKWQSLYDKFKSRGENAWLDQIMESIDRITRNENPIAVMQAFTMPDGKAYIPVVTRVETFPSTDDNQNEIIIPKQLCVIFTYIPNNQPPPYTLTDMRDLIEKWYNYPPTSVVKIKWKKRRGIKYDAEDMIDEPYVCAANSEFARLWNFTYKEFFPNPNDDPNLRLTDKRLFEFIEGYIDPEHLDKFLADQEQLAKRIIFQSQDGLAKIPMQFNDQHHDVEYRNQAYLPYLISKHKIGDDQGPHEMYLLVCYIKDFLPLTE